MKMTTPRITAGQMTALLHAPASMEGRLTSVTSATLTPAAATSATEAGRRPYSPFCTRGLSLNLPSMRAMMRMTRMEGLMRPSVATMPPGTPAVM